MKTKSVSSHNPRSLISALSCVLLALLAFVAFPASTALAVPSQCADVTFEEYVNYYGGPVYVELESTAGCTIFYVINSNPVGDPHHTASPPPIYPIYPTQTYPTPPFAGLGVPRGSVRYFSARAYKYLASPSEDSANVTYYFVDNTGN